MHYSVSKPDSLLEIHVTDGITKAEVLQLWETIEKHPNYHKIPGILVLFGRDMRWHMSAKEIRDLARDSVRLRNVPWAIVAHDPLSFGMTRMFALQTEDERRYRVFENEAEARGWLRQFPPVENDG